MIKIIIVDDEKMIREGLVSTVPWGEMGIEVVGSADNGKTALEIALEKKPHIILTDIRMPKMDGIQLLQQVKAELPKVKVVILSGYDEFAYAQKALKYGAADYLIKPVNVDDLKELMEQLKDSIREEVNEDILWIRIQKELEDEVRQYIMHVRSGNIENVYTLLEKVVHKEVMSNISLEQYKKLSINMINNLLIALKEEGIEIKEDINDKYMNLMNLAKLEELKDWIKEFTNEIIEIIKSDKQDNYRVVIKNALEYIQNHFKEDLSIQMVADAVHLSPNYFSHVFKKAKQESFTDYLNKVRVKKAQELLSEHFYKVYEVADMVGYSDYKYFSSVFKKISGISPTEYSELYIKK